MEAKRKQPNHVYLTHEQLKENSKASKRKYYMNNRHEWLQPGGRYYACLHRKLACSNCGIVCRANNLKRHQASSRCVKDSTPS